MEQRLFCINLKKRPEVLCDGYDISSSAIEIAKTKETSDIQFYCEDFCNSNTPHKQYDLILLIDIIEHIEDMYKMLRFVKKYTSHVLISFSPVYKYPRSVLQSANGGAKNSRASFLYTRCLRLISKKILKNPTGQYSKTINILGHARPLREDIWRIFIDGSRVLTNNSVVR